MSTPTILLAFCHASEVVGYCAASVQGSVLGIVVDLSVLPYFLRLFSGPYRAGVPGRLVPVGSDCASWRRAVSRDSAHPRFGDTGRGQKWYLARPSGRRGRSEAGRSGKRGLSVGEAGQSQKRASFLLGQTFRSEIGLLFWPVV